jgi:hypothetical protein
LANIAWLLPGLYPAALADRPSSFDYSYMASLLNEYDTGMVNGVLPHNVSGFLSKKKKEDPDQPAWHEAMKSPEAENWLEAAEVELTDLQEKQKTWTEMHKKDLPPGANPLPGTWALKVKRYPDGRFRKFKARYCVRGDKQLEGVDYFQTYAPVVSWLTVRMLLIVSAVSNLTTVQVDYDNAFAQATLEENIYLKLPTGCTGKYGDDTVLKLNKSLYGLKQAAICWFDKLKDGLLAQGWTQPLPILEPCLFAKDGVICLVYVDDCLFFGRSNDKIQALIKEIQDAGFALSIESDVYAFLGVEFSIDAKSGKCSMTQTGLIDKSSRWLTWRTVISNILLLTKSLLVHVNQHPTIMNPGPTLLLLAASITWQIIQDQRYNLQFINVQGILILPENLIPLL